MLRKSLLSICVIVSSIGLSIAGGYYYISKFTTAPKVQTYCIDSTGKTLIYEEGTPMSAECQACMSRRAQTFLSKDYEICKDLSKAFLTLLAALLVGSITFSEKIINLGSASMTPRTLMILCWLFLLAAIITCGAGLALMTLGAGWAAYQPFTTFETYEISAVYLYSFSGLGFATGLICLLAAGIISLNESKPAAVAKTTAASKIPADTGASTPDSEQGSDVE